MKLEGDEAWYQERAISPGVRRECSSNKRTIAKIQQCQCLSLQMKPVDRTLSYFSSNDYISLSIDRWTFCFEEIAAFSRLAHGTGVSVSSIGHAEATTKGTRVDDVDIQNAFAPRGWSCRTLQCSFMEFTNQAVRSKVRWESVTYGKNIHIGFAHSRRGTTPGRSWLPLCEDDWGLKSPWSKAFSVLRCWWRGDKNYGENKNLVPSRSKLGKRMGRKEELLTNKTSLDGEGDEIAWICALETFLWAFTDRVLPDRKGISSLEEFVHAAW